MTTPDPARLIEIVTAAGRALHHRTPATSTDLDDLIAAFTAANTQAADRIRTALAASWPEIGWLDGELDGTDLPRDGAHWVCDPIDGAVQHLRGLPTWSVSLTLFRDGRPELAVVHAPATDEVFHAVRGGGAHRDGAPIRVSAQTRLDHAVLATSHPSDTARDTEDTDWATTAIRQITPRAFAVRMLGAGSLQLAWVAAGRLDGFWENGADRFDWLAGSLLVSEAGGVVTDLAGGPLGDGLGGVVAAGPALHPDLLRALPGTGRSAR